MKTAILILAAAIAAAPVVQAGSLTLSGKPEQLRFELQTFHDERTVKAIVPRGVEPPSVVRSGLKSYSTKTTDAGEYEMTFVFWGSLSVDDRRDAGPVTVRDDGAVAGPTERREIPRASTVASTPEGEKTADSAPATEDKPKLAFGRLALTLPSEESLRDRSPSYDAAIPESPAAAVLGSSSKLVRFNDTKDAVTQLLSVPGDDGKIANGFSFAFHPYRLLAHPTLERYTYGAQKPTRLDDYSGGNWVRFFSRLDLSLAATIDDSPGAGGARGASGAIGISGFVFNRGDSRLALAEKFAPRAFEETFDSDQGPDSPPKVEDVTSEEFTKLANEAYASLWNRSYWAFGAAKRLRSDTGSLSDFRGIGGAVWTTLGYGFEGADKGLGLDFLERNSQLLLHGTFRDNQHVAAQGTTPAFLEDVLVYGAQLRVGREGFNAFGEILWEKHRPRNQPRRSSETYYFGFEKRLKPDLWLQVAIGSEEKPQSNGREALLRTALSYAFGDPVASSATKK